MSKKILRSKESHVLIVSGLLAVLNDVLLMPAGKLRDEAENKLRKALKEIQENIEVVNGEI